MQQNFERKMLSNKNSVMGKEWKFQTPWVRGLSSPNPGQAAAEMANFHPAVFLFFVFMKEIMFVSSLENPVNQ